MKKCKRWLAIVFVSLLCLSLCGCQELDDMRASHAVWQEDGTILWNGNVYRLLENAPDELQVYGGSTVYVTEVDVPVLLSPEFGEYFTSSKDGVLLRGYNVYDVGGRYIYCREDRYEEIVAYLEATTEEKEMSQYFYCYWSFETNEQEYYYFTPDQKAVMDDLMATLVFEPVPIDFYGSADLDMFSVQVGKCDEKRLFVDDYALEIIFRNSRYYLTDANEGGYIAQVPEDYNKVMDDIVRLYYETYYGFEEPPHIVVE